MIRYDGPMRLAVLAVAVVLHGCSLVSVRGAPSVDTGVRPLGCTTSVAAPVLDTVPAAILLLITTSVVADISNDPPGSEGRALAGGLVAIVFGIPGVVLAGSAVYGYTRTARCRAMNRRPVAPVAPAVPTPMPTGPPGGM